LPASDSAAELGKFGDIQTGQLDKSNADKGTAQYVLTECEALLREAQRPRRPWWRLFG
jgi:hypothetical protein